MASRADKLYGDSPSLERDTDSGAMKVAKTNKDDEMKNALSGEGGAGGEPLHMRHANERHETHVRHIHERMQMHQKHQVEHAGGEDKAALHARHETEHEAMNSRHHAEKKALHKRHEKELSNPGGVHGEPTKKGGEKKEARAEPEGKSGDKKAA